MNIKLPILLLFLSIHSYQIASLLPKQIINQPNCRIIDLFSKSKHTTIHSSKKYQILTLISDNSRTPYQKLNSDETEKALELLHRSYRSFTVFINDNLLSSPTDKQISAILQADEDGQIEITSSANR